MQNINPITKQDYPDPDIIRVNDTYYLLSTTMHFFPGGAILRSYDLVNWEIVNYLYADELDGASNEALAFEQNIYGRGMWAPTLRYHNGTFYALFVSIEAQNTYLFTTTDPLAKWEKKCLTGMYYDASLLFDEDKVYIIHGNRHIYATELDLEKLTAKEGGLNKEIFADNSDSGLGYEGSHAYKINGYYYVFNIHWPRNCVRTQVVHRAASIEGPYEKKILIQDDCGLRNKGVAQGGVVDTPDGKWYGFFFRDQGACGRVPFLTPITWEENFPVVGSDYKIPEFEAPASTNPKHKYEPLYTSDITENVNGCNVIKKQWQWNHTPDSSSYSIGENTYSITTDKICTSIVQARNTLTQRTYWDKCSAEVTVDASHINEFDHAGFAIFSSCYGQLSITKELNEYYLCLITREGDEVFDGRHDTLQGNLIEKIRLDSPIIRLRIDVDFEGLKDIARFSYKTKKSYESLSFNHKMAFKLDHFCGCRFALFNYSTRRIGGTATFSDFKYTK